MPRPRKAATNSGDPAELIKQAIAGLDAQIQEWTSKRDQLARLLPEGSASAAFTGRRRGRPPGSKNKAAAAGKSAKANAKPKRKVSAATRRKLKEAARARWARIKGEQEG